MPRLSTPAVVAAGVLLCPDARLVCASIVADRLDVVGSGLVARIFPTKFELVVLIR